MLQHTYMLLADNFLVIIDSSLSSICVLVNDQSGMNWGDRNHFPFTFVLVRSSWR